MRYLENINGKDIKIHITHTHMKKRLEYSFCMRIELTDKNAKRYIQEEKENMLNIAQNVYKTTDVKFRVAKTKKHICLYTYKV